MEIDDEMVNGKLEEVKRSKVVSARDQRGGTSACHTGTMATTWRQNRRLVGVGSIINE